MTHPTLQSFALIAAFASAANADPATLQVSVKAPDTTPLNNVPLKAYATGSEAVAVTDEHGVASFALDVDPSATTITVELVGGGAIGGELAYQAMLSNRLMQLTAQYHLPHALHIPAKVGQQSYQAVLQAQPGITVHGALSLPNDGSAGLPCAVWGTWSPFSSREWTPQSVTAFELRGAPIGEDLILIVGCDVAHGGASSVLLVPAEQVQPDGSVGSVEVPPLPPTDCSPQFQLAANLADWQAIPGIGQSSLWGALFISEDGTRTYNSSVRSETELMRRPMPMASGTYFVVPGDFMLSREQLLMLNALRKGQDLSNTNIPRITLAEGFDGVIQLDLVQAEHAIRAAFGIE